MTQTDSTFISTLLKLRQSRKFLDQPIPAEIVEELLEVARWTGSAKNTQPWEFIVVDDRDTNIALSKAGVEYVPLPELGGRRRPRPDSHNTVWRNESFRGYADYMQTDAFRAGIDELLKIAEGDTVAIMCAEAVPWRCHRSLVGDALLVRGVTVHDIFGVASVKPHLLTRFASVDGTTITYPPISELV